jgi:hypothetical protein
VVLAEKRDLSRAITAVYLDKPSFVSANDATRLDAGKVAFCKFVVAVIVKDNQTLCRRGTADQQVNNRKRTHCARRRQPVLRRINPLPNGFGHRHIRIDVMKRLVHLIELVRIPR